MTDFSEKHKILSHLSWTFNEKKYESKEIFNRQVEQHQINLSRNSVWHPFEIVISKAEIKMLLDFDWEMPPDDKIKFVFKSSNSNGFTALDLMFQLNNFLADYDLGDSHFFEGLEYIIEKDQYLVKLGS